MHLLRVESRSIDGTAEAVDLGQTPADIVALSFTDTDLSRSGCRLGGTSRSASQPAPGESDVVAPPLFGRSLSEKVVAKARFVLVRLLGGMDYWRYGVDELAALCRARRHAISRSCRAITARMRGWTRPRRCRSKRAAADLVLFCRQVARRISAPVCNFAAGHLMIAPPAPAPIEVHSFGVFAPAQQSDAAMHTQR